jgi:tetratricopeptide (TPR) repeat protein
MRATIILFLLFITFNMVTGQQKIIDSLKLELNNSKPDTNRVLLLTELIISYYQYKPDTAILLGQQAYELSQKLNYAAGEALSLNRIAAAYATVGDYAKSLIFLTKALNISTGIKDEVGIARAFNNLGDTYLTQADYPKALGLFKRSISYSVNFRDPYPMSVTSLNIGRCYLYLHQYDSALFYFQNTSSMAAREKFNDLNGDIERGLGEIETAISRQHCIIFIKVWTIIKLLMINKTLVLPI